MEKKSKKSILIGVTSLLLVMLLLVGLTYAYYRTRIIGNEKEKSVSVTSEKLELTYINGNELINEEEIEPGDIITKTFIVKNTGDDIVKYSVYLENILNEFVNKQDLILSVTCSSELKDNSTGTCEGLNESQYPSSNEKIITNSINEGETHSYTITLNYKNSVYNQSDDIGKKLSGTVYVYAEGDVFDLIIDASQLNQDDYIELHSNPKTAYLYDGKYKFVGVEKGKHTLKVLDKNGNVKGTTEINIKKSNSYGVEGNTIYVTDNMVTMNLKIDSITNNEIKLGEIDYISYHIIEQNGVKYALENINDAILNSTEDKPATLLENVELTSDLNITASNKNMYLDLNGYTISGNDNCSNIINFQGENSNLNIKNGTINAVDTQMGLRIGTRYKENQNINVIVENDVIINSNYYGIYIYGEESHLNLYGTINIASEGYGVSGNGLDSGPEINVYDGAKINVANGMGIYLAHKGVTTINGGTITAGTAIGIKAGTLNVLGGTLKATGENKTPVVNKNGISFTGDVIFAEIHQYYHRNINVNIEGGEMLSDNANIIRTLHSPDVDMTDEINIIKITGKYTTQVVDSTNNNISTYN